MSYEQKYLKYKQKYLNLKRQLAEEMNQQGGGNQLTLDDIEHLTETPSDVAAYGYELTGGSLNNVQVSENNEEAIVTTTTLEEVSQHGGNVDSDLEVSLDSSESISENLETSEPETSVLSGGARARSRSRSRKSSESSSLSDLDSESMSSDSDSD